MNLNPKIKPTEPYLFTEKCAAKLSHLSDPVEAAKKQREITFKWDEGGQLNIAIPSNQ